MDETGGYFGTGPILPRVGKFVSFDYKSGGTKASHGSILGTVFLIYAQD